MMKPGRNLDTESSQEPVSINVGGQLYTTTRDTLTRYRDSMLGAMFTGNLPLLRDTSGNIFIDRDGKVFRYILNFLRSSSLDLPQDFAEMSLLKREVDFFQIHALQQEICLYELGLQAGGCRQALLTAQVDREVQVLHFNLKRAPENYELCSCPVTIYTAGIFCTSSHVLQLLRMRFHYCNQSSTQGDKHYLHLQWAPRPEDLPIDLYQKHQYQQLLVVSPAVLPEKTHALEVMDSRVFLQELIKISLAEGFRLDAMFPDGFDILDCRSLRFVRY